MTRLDFYTNNDEVFDKCIGKGSWRICLACAEHPPSDHDTENTTTEGSDKICAMCGQQRPAEVYTMHNDICDSCQLQDRFQTIICSKCGKPTRGTQTLPIAHGDKETRVCLKCAPHERPIECTVCKTSKHPSAFTARHRSAEAKKTGIMRCKTCSEQCSACGRHITDDKHFATNSSQCWKCFRQKR